MKVKLIGVADVEFTSTDGTQIKGTSIYTNYEDPNVQGMACKKFFLKPEIKVPNDLKLGEDVQLYFNMNGKVEAVAR